MDTKMNISSEMLAAYAEGKVFGAERDAIRKYLADNPSELQTVAIMMDEDYDLDVDDSAREPFDYAGETDDSSDFSIALSAAAFAPQSKSMSKPIVNKSPKQRMSFDSCLNDLLDDIF